MRSSTRAAIGYLIGAPIQRDYNRMPTEDPLVVNGVRVHVLIDDCDWPDDCRPDDILLWMRWDSAYRLHFAEWIWFHEVDAWLYTDFDTRDLLSLCLVLEERASQNPHTRVFHQPINRPLGVGLGAPINPELPRELITGVLRATDDSPAHEEVDLVGS